ncbi:MAG: heat shock protein HspQ [Myxococcota bacterium]|nr:heat shock protein HspQ [Myxococcota bacterium]MDP6242973.1 heat shock protein HspQ [Myxococcota bacterium]MDP7075375.1 heat shock protein HspQ [Myxococcota bacterium]MDP7433454.1 heat shock protein HspQ [Myxococcota bacterium]HJO23119.1 heat shock protein HspQ [Myxococcota bacterium]
MAWRRDSRILPVVEEVNGSGKFRIGQVVKHRLHPFRGVVFDVDPTFSNTEQWWLAIPEDVRPRREQPYYHLLAENAETTYVAYVSEQNLLPDETGSPCRHPMVSEIFGELHDGFYTLARHRPN